jgi:hypothetical protein
MMSNMRLPRYPVYIPSRGRSDECLTARFLEHDGVPFRLVVEPQEHDLYAARFGAERLLVLPEKNTTGLHWARNWIKDHAVAEGHARHWQLDDNCRRIARLYQGRRIPCAAGVALAATEDFVDRYENIAVAGLNYEMFLPSTYDGIPTPPFRVNVHVYSCSLILNSIPNRWRCAYNDDTDLCLQVLADGWCTLLMNAFMVKKMTTMTMHGGNTDDFYQGDGRLRMSRSLERLWPGVVETKRRYGRPQHVINWRKFRTELRLKPGLSVTDGPDEYGMVLGPNPNYCKGAATP